MLEMTHPPSVWRLAIELPSNLYPKRNNCKCHCSALWLNQLGQNKLMIMASITLQIKLISTVLNEHKWCSSPCKSTISSREHCTVLHRGSVTLCPLWHSNTTEISVKATPFKGSNSTITEHLQNFGIMSHSCSEKGPGY